MIPDVFTPIDQHFAGRVLKNYPAASAAEFFLKALFFAARQGHLCLDMKRENWLLQSSHLFGQEFAKEISAEIQFSLQALPKDLVHDNSSFSIKPVCRQGDRYYLQRFFFAETSLLNDWKRILQAKPFLNVQAERLEKSLLSLQSSALPEQIQAIKLACEKSLFVLTGGPGTGKTYTAGQMLHIFFQALLPEDRARCRVSLAAPTGKAASNLEKSLRKVLGDTHSVKGQTLHSLLGIKSHVSETKALASDLILVDESSMIDVELMAKLLASVKTGARLILIGDKDQLPPVEAGSVFGDLCEVHSDLIHLKTCLRAELKVLVDFARLVNDGDSEQALKMLSQQENLLRVDPQEKSLQGLLSQLADRFNFEGQPEEALNHMNRFRILTPLKKGPFGTEALNLKILQEVKKKQRKSPFVIPIMINVNQPSRELYNGEMGVLVKWGDIASPLSSQDLALFPGGRQLPAILLQGFEYAYCLSVHKSQGSEFEEVFLILPEGSETFGRKVIYTAVTRAKKKLMLYGSEEVFRKTLFVDSKRFSGIGERFNIRPLS